MTITYPLLVNALIAGLLMGGFYAALSVGATVAFGLLDIVNIADPTFAVIALTPFWCSTAPSISTRSSAACC